MKNLLMSCSLALLLSCSNDEKAEGVYIMESAPIGQTFENMLLSITFESKDSLSFVVKDNHSWNNKARYIFRFGGTVEIINPYGRDAFKEVDDAYFVNFEGQFISPDELESNTMFLFCAADNRHNALSMVGSYSFFKSDPNK